MAEIPTTQSKSTELDEQQQQRADAILQHLRTHADQHLQELATLFASKPDSELFGQTEFEARDILHRIGAQAVQAAVDSHKRGVLRC